MPHSIDHTANDPNQARSLPSARSVSWRIALPFLGLLALFLIWSGYWWVASSMSRHGFEDWVQKAAQHGMTLSCNDQDWGGYPFRIEMSCVPLKLSWASKAGAGSIDLGRLETVFQLYNPRHVLAAGAPPATYRIGEAGLAAPSTIISTSFGEATSSLIFSEGDLARTDLVLKEAVADFGGRDGYFAQGRARYLEVHTRFIERAGGPSPVLEFAASGQEVSLAGPAVTSATGIPIELDRLTLRGETDTQLNTTLDPSSALREFVAKGGVIKITRLNGQHEAVNIDATGEVTFDAQGRANGDLATEVTNLKSILDQLREAGRLGELEAAFSLNMLTMLEGATSGREGALHVKVAIRNGNVYFGPFEILELPPLF